MLSLIMTIFVLSMLPMQAMAADQASLKVSFPVTGAKLELYQVATLDGVLTDQFAGSGVKLVNHMSASQIQNAASKLASWAEDHKYTGISIPSDSYTYYGVGDGVWLIVQQNMVTGYTVMQPTLFLCAGDSIEIDPKVSPYTPPDLTDVSVTKVWKGADSSKPTSVSVQLYRDGTPYGSAVKLSAANSWTYTWKDLNAGHIWKVDEVNVPSGYLKSIKANGNVFTITNTRKVITTTPPGGSTITITHSGITPKTGDPTMLALWVSCLSVSAAVILIILAVIMKRHRHHGEDQ